MNILHLLHKEIPTVCFLGVVVRLPERDAFLRFEKPHKPAPSALQFIFRDEFYDLCGGVLFKISKHVTKIESLST